ncbi:hypothetical protein CBR65_18235 [Cellvibrio sp. PSBB006]|nr:hypothetical protein CBR65_18235 [Cellvibrio sp. PSBB006]
MAELPLAKRYHTDMKTMWLIAFVAKSLNYTETFSVSVKNIVPRAFYSEMYRLSLLFALLNRAINLMVSL